MEKTYCVFVVKKYDNLCAVELQMYEILVEQLSLSLTSLAVTLSSSRRYTSGRFSSTTQCDFSPLIIPRCFLTQPRSSVVNIRRNTWLIYSARHTDEAQCSRAQVQLPEQVPLLDLTLSSLRRALRSCSICIQL